MWAIITVVEEGTMDLTQRLSHLSELGTFHYANIIPNPFRHRTSFQHVRFILVFIDNVYITFLTLFLG